MKTYKILLNDTVYEYDVTEKNIKSFRIRVEEGRMKISVPLGMKQTEIEKYIHKFKDRLLPQLIHYEPYYDLEKGTLDYFGQRYSIIIDQNSGELFQIQDRSIILNKVINEKELLCILKENLMQYIEERVLYYLAYEFDLNLPKIEVKQYKRRWGSCYYKENKISFHLALVHLDKRLIDYVIVHELSHFIQPNHSQEFYSEIEKRMPDYKARKLELKEKHI